MVEPEIGGRAPVIARVEPGEYWWCRCGRSQSQPYCDGSHAGTGFEPLRFELDRPRRLALCTCKRTSNPPYCDGTHLKLGE